MIYFLVVIFLFILFYIFDVLKKTDGSNFFWFLSFAVIALLAGLRYKVGGDTFAYLNNYENYPSFFEFSSFDFENAPYEIFWYVFCAVCKIFSNSYFFMQIIHAIVVNIIYFYFIHKYVKYRFLGVLLYFIFGFLYFNTEIMREALSVGVFLLSLDSFYEKKWIRYFIFAAIAFLFHSSALILVIFPFFQMIQLNKFFLISVLVILIISNILWQVFNDYIQYFNAISTVGNKVNSYLDNDEYIYNINGMIRSIFTYFFVPFLFAVFAFRTTNQENKETPFLWLYIVFGIFTIFNQVVFSRLQNYLFFPFIVYISNICYEVAENRISKQVLVKDVKIVVLFVCLFIGRYYSFFKLDLYDDAYVYQRYFPYYSIITEKTSPARASLEYYGQ